MRGSAIIAAMMLVVIGVFSAGGYLGYVSKETQMAKRMDCSVKALYVAEAGLERGLADFSSDTDWFDGSINGFATGTIPIGSYVTIQYNGTNPVSFGNGTYFVEVSRDATYTSRINLLSTGVFNGVTRKVNITIRRETIFDYAIGAKGTISLSNHSTTDSYNSTIGTYGGSNLFSNGHMRTNAGDGAGGLTAISLTNNATINGNAIVGPYGDANSDITTTNNSTISGIKAVAPNALLFPSITPPSTLPVRSAISLNGNNTTTISQDGQYPSISISNNSTVRVTGNVTVYVTGNFTLSNNGKVEINDGASLKLYVNCNQFNICNNTKMNNNTQNPAKLTIYATDNVTTVNYSNNTTFYGTIYAPNADFACVNGVDFYGCLVAKTINFSNNPRVHYDEALCGTGLVAGSMVADNWREAF